MNKKRKKFMMIAVACMCAMITMPTRGLAQQRSLRVESASWVLRKFPVREAAERFQKDHPTIQVRVTSLSAEEMTKVYLLEWGTGKTGIDLVLDETPTKMAPLVGADLLVDLSDMLTGFMARENFILPLLEDARFVKDGEPYYPMLPFTGEVMALNVNKQLYEKAGLADIKGNPVAAKDWDEFEEHLKKLKAVSPGPAFSVDWGWNFTLYSYAGGIQAMKGSIYDAKGVLDIESWAAKKWLELNQKWISEGLASAGTLTDVNYGRNNYKAGIIPAIYTSHSRFIEAGETLGVENTSMVPIPGSIENGSIIFITPVLVPKASKNTDLAKLFIREQIFSKWFQQWDYNRYGKLPVMPAFYGEGLTWYQDEAGKLLKICQESAALPKYKGNEQLLDIFLEELAKLFVGRESVEEMLKNVKEKIELRDVDLSRLD